MEKITVFKRNETFLQIDCDTSIRYELEEYFKFEIPNAKFNPKVRAKVWDGYIRLYSIYKSLLHVGLFEQLKDFCDMFDYQLVVLSSDDYGTPGETTNITPKELGEFVKELNIPEEIEVRDYQYYAAYLALKKKRQIILSPTASGKSLIFYFIIRYLLSQNKRILLVVPTTSLVAQMAGDFHEYSVNLGHDIDKHVHQIYSGKEKETNALITVSTWQSIYTMPRKWFHKFDAVFCDEVHLGKAASLTTVLESCTEAEFKVGMTGSLDESKTHKQMLRALYGDITRVATTRALIDKGFVTNININCISLKYSKETSKLFTKQTYQKEIDFIVGHERRNRFITKLAGNLKGNTLILFNLVDKHGKVLHELIKKAHPERQVYFVSGESGVDHREEVRSLTESGTDVIIIASLGVFSTGVNIKRLHNVVFASPTKSMIRVLQSIGRGLRLAHDKDVFELYDISDDLTVTRKVKKNYTYEHFKERLRIYASEGFPYKITEVDIE